MSEKPAINTHVRLFDLVRFMRSELHQADLITDEEYAWLCMEAPMAKGQGRWSPRRLEDYDQLRIKMSEMRAALVEIEAGAMAPFDSFQDAYGRGRARAALALAVTK